MSVFVKDNKITRLPMEGTPEGSPVGISTPIERGRCMVTMNTRSGQSFAQFYFLKEIFGK